MRGDSGRERSFGGPVLAAALVVGVGLGVLGLAGVIAAPASATPWGGSEPTPTNLVFYLHNSSTGVTVGAVQYLDILSTSSDAVAPWAGTGGLAEGSHYDSVSLVAAPELSGPLVLNGTVSANVYLNESGSAPSGGSITLSVYAVSTTGTLTRLGAGPANSATPLGPGGSLPKLVALTGPTLSQTVPAGDSVEVNLTISGNTAESYGIWWGTIAGTTYASTVTMAASTYLTVPLVRVLNGSGSAVAYLSPSSGNTTVAVRAVVSDPLGAYDFESFPPELTVVDPATSAVVQGPFPMSATPALAAPGAPNGSYVVPFNYSGLAPGGYDFTVTSVDNTNENLGPTATMPVYYGREAIGVESLAVGLPPVPVQVLAVDGHGQPLRGAVVQARSGGTLLAENTTNASGRAGFDLSNASTFAVSALWQGVDVGTVSVAVSGPGQLVVLNTSVSYPTFRLETASGDPLSYALVSLVHPNGTALPLLVANASGELTLDQAPDGNYTLTAVYEDAVVVARASEAVTGDGPFVVVASSVYTLAVSTVGSGGSPLSEVFVQVVNATTGATIASGVTGASGELDFLVPAGGYRVLGSWSTTYALTSLSESQRDNVSVTGPGEVAVLTFSKAYPSFTSTNEFFLLVGYGVLAVLVLLLGLLMLRRRRSPPARAASTPDAASGGPGPVNP